MTKTDLKRSFVSFLYRDLQRAGISTFLDEFSLRPGDKPEPTMLAAIRGCRIAIAVFSESYGNSQYCLNELVAMARGPNILIIPIFMGSYEAIRQHILKSIKFLAGSLPILKEQQQVQEQLWTDAFETACQTGWRLGQTDG